MCTPARRSRRTARGFTLLEMLVVLVIAPAFGLLVERVLMRGLGEAPVSVSLVVTVGLFVALIGGKTEGSAA